MGYYFGLSLHHAHTQFLLFIPHLFGIVLFWDVVEIAVFIHSPTAEDAEVEFIPVTLGFSLPDKFVACSETDAGVGVEVDTDGLFLVILYDGKNVTILQFLHLCASKVIAVCYILDVSADDRGWNTEHLPAFWIKLEETLAAEFLANLVALQMTDDRLSCNKVLLLLLIEEFQV